MIFYTADLHLGHENIMRLSKRPFSSVKEMDDVLIDNINNKVGVNDDLYIIGDFTYKGGDPVGYLERIKCRKHLIIGNHDGKLLSNRTATNMFVERPRDYSKIKDNDKDVVLCHYPIAEWDGYFRGTYHIFGHVHNNFGNPWYAYMSKLKNCFNAGVDVNDYEPMTLKELIERNS